jgi:hypothetical protein
VDADLDPTLFASDLQIANTQNKREYVFMLILIEGASTLQHSSKIKSKKEVPKQ